jgi:hypothetical protein
MNIRAFAVQPPEPGWTALSERVHFRVGDGLEVRIAARKQWWPLVFLPFWWTLWTLCGIFAIVTLVSGGAEEASGFLLLWLCGWFAGWVMAAFFWFWMMFGREVIRANRDNLTVAYELFGKQRARSYRSTEITNLRAAGVFGALEKNASAQFGIGGGTIAFDTGNKAVRFGNQLEEAEARSIVERFGRYLPEEALAPGYQPR